MDVDTAGVWLQAFGYISSVKTTRDKWPNDLRIKQPLNVLTGTPPAPYTHITRRGLDVTDWLTGLEAS